MGTWPCIIVLARAEVTHALYAHYKRLRNLQQDLTSYRHFEQSNTGGKEEGNEDIITAERQEGDEMLFYGSPSW